VRAWSADALGLLHDSGAVESLIVLLHDDESQVRNDAAVSLGKIGDGRAIDPLVARLSDSQENDYVRMTAARALGHIVRGEVFPPLVAALNDPVIDVRCQALWALAESGGAQAVDTLLTHTSDPDPCVRHAAVHALAEVGDESLIPLLERIEHQDTGGCRAALVRQSAGWAMKRIKERHGI
jgi:HEAT repeat protein